eukprot:gene10263-biopygen4584
MRGVWRHGPVVVPLRRYLSTDEGKATEPVVGKKPRSKTPGASTPATLATETIPLLLDVFRKLYHHANVPTAFVVPAEEPWPQELHGDRLGRRIDYLRSLKDRLPLAQVEQLDNAGMVWSHEEYQVGRIERGLTTYKAMYGGVRIPNLFVVPHGDGRWDRDLWDMKLGSAIDMIRNDGAYEVHRSRFEALGLTFDRWIEPQYPFALVRQALESFYGRYGHYEVPMTYGIAADDAAYAEPVRGMKLGQIVSSIIHDELYAEHRGELEAMGVPLMPRKELMVDRICEAVRCYRREYGEKKRIPSSYKVPEESSSYSRELWGLALGRAVYRICKRGAYADYRDRFEALGFKIESPSPLDTLMEDKLIVVATLLPLFRQLYHHANVPKAFVVPAEEPWPRELHGDRLGMRIRDLRAKKKRLSPAQVEQLDNAGMVWSHEGYQVGRIERGLTTYKAMYGDVRIPEQFVVPHGDGRWDRDLWDMKLGRAIDMIRNDGAYEAHRSRFEALGLTFDRWIEPQYPFALVRQALESFHGRYGHYEVPTTYVVAADDGAYAVPVRGMKLGQIVQTIIHDELYAEHRGELEAMGVPLMPRRELMVDRICEAVRCYRREYGEMKRIPLTYKVPEESSSYPRELWGLALGRAVYNICIRGAYADYRDRFETLGLDIETSADQKEASS